MGSTILAQNEPRSNGHEDALKSHKHLELETIHRMVLCHIQVTRWRIFPYPRDVAGVSYSHNRQNWYKGGLKNSLRNKYVSINQSLRYTQRCVDIIVPKGLVFMIICLYFSHLLTPHLIPQLYYCTISEKTLCITLSMSILAVICFILIRLI